MDIWSFIPSNSKVHHNIFEEGKSSVEWEEKRTSQNLEFICIATVIRTYLLDDLVIR